jgi:hypothetical protein
MKGIKIYLVILGLMFFPQFIFAADSQDEYEASLNKSTEQTITSSSDKEKPIDKGSLNIGGTLAIQSMGGDLYEYDYERQNMIMFTPQVRYVVLPNLAVGGNMTYARQAQGDNSNTEFSYHLQSLKPEEGDSESGNMIVFGLGFAVFLY